MTAAPVERHLAWFGAEPEGLWTAPGRVNLIGEHTDYNDGFVLPFALPLTTLAAASRSERPELRLRSAEAPGPAVTVPLDHTLAPGSVTGWAAYPAGVAWALREAGHHLTGADLSFTSTLPLGAGLSSSAALEVATALALDDLNGLGLPRERLAALARRAENAYVGVPCGILDQMASACCTAGHVLHLDTRAPAGHRHLPFTPTLDDLALLLADTRTPHAHAEGAYARRRAECHAAARALGVPTLRDLPHEALPGAVDRLADPVLRRRARHVLTENERVARVAELLGEGRAREIGPLLTESHQSLRDDFEVSVPALDLAVSAALSAGALGARLTGGGFGGSAILLTDAAAAGAVTDALRAAFAGAGLQLPVIRPVFPAAGAQRQVG
ncbi:galactokinase [Streptomyces sp. DSM 44917]|uniref:Galactokinase n=1 Tax=Streptomyces boetiae TaxID=3075541 RepID=A0ABU2L942_9ACTN|nr:galactokinase [Streptomyces sp. DSM 44917]MDT0308010.1 galactokinase [Streptomyces sp. DSM 44917]